MTQSLEITKMLKKKIRKKNSTLTFSVFLSRPYDFCSAKVFTLSCARNVQGLSIWNLWLEIF